MESWKSSSAQMHSPSTDDVAREMGRLLCLAETKRSTLIDAPPIAAPSIDAKLSPANPANSPGGFFRSSQSLGSLSAAAATPGAGGVRSSSSGLLQDKSSAGLIPMSASKLSQLRGIWHDAPPAYSRRSVTPDRIRQSTPTTTPERKAAGDP